jgi:tRNA threonylcarbamoyladenosine biosynthesis protein TsaE
MEEKMKKIMSFKELDTLAEKLSDYAEENTTIALIGDLGTGKTTFTQTFAKRLGVKESLKSPTFNYVLEYFSGRLPLYHFDVYRLDDISELENIGFYEYTEDCVSIVEWADKFPDELPDETLWIYLTRIDDTSRSITLTSDYLTAEELVEIGGPYVVGN